MTDNRTIFTVGHSTRTADEFIALLREFQIEMLADIRRFPSSRKYPQFNAAPLRESLQNNGIGYVWFESLGGRRESASDQSPNTLLRNAGFRNYADYMMTDQFGSGVRRLCEIARLQRTAVMCAERFYWKCHRMLLSDYLVVNGWEVVHILDSGKTRRHELFKGARPGTDGFVIYAPLPAHENE